MTWFLLGLPATLLFLVMTYIRCAELASENFEKDSIGACFLLGIVVSFGVGFLGPIAGIPAIIFILSKLSSIYFKRVHGDKNARLHSDVSKQEGLSS